MSTNLGREWLVHSSELSLLPILQNEETSVDLPDGELAAADGGRGGDQQLHLVPPQQRPQLHDRLPQLHVRLDQSETGSGVT